MKVLSYFWNVITNLIKIMVINRLKKKKKRFTSVELFSFLLITVNCSGVFLESSKDLITSVAELKKKNLKYLIIWNWLQAHTELNMVSQLSFQFCFVFFYFFLELFVYRTTLDKQWQSMKVVVWHTVGYLTRIPLTQTQYKKFVCKRHVDYLLKALLLHCH